MSKLRISLKFSLLVCLTTVSFWTNAQSQAEQAAAQAKEKTEKYSELSAALWKKIDTLDRKGFLLLLDAHEKQNQWMDVIRAANTMLARYPDNVEALTYIGKAYYNQKPIKLAEAKESLRKAIEIDKKYEPAYLVLAKIYQNNPYEERLLYQDMLETFGEKAEFLTRLCQINTTDGENEQGETFCQKAVQVDPKNPLNHVNLGIISRQKTEPTVARRRLKYAAEKFSDSELAQKEYAIFLESEKNFLDAFKFYKKCTEINPKSEVCLLGIGSTGIQIQKQDESLLAFKTICKNWKRKHLSKMRKTILFLSQQNDTKWKSSFQDLVDKCAFE